MPELNVGNENSVELVKGESGLSDAIVNNEAKSLERTETSQVGVYVENTNDYSDTSRTLQVSQENNHGVYVKGGSQAEVVEREKVVDTILVKEVKSLIEDSKPKEDKKVKANDIDSGNATSGQVLTADGSKGASFQNVPTPSQITYLTTAPASANTGSLKFVVLSEEPATKYSGYVYFITGE